MVFKALFNALDTLSAASFIKALERIKLFNRLNMQTINKCRICGKETKLTYEHIPPRSANNKSRVNILTDDSFIKLVTDQNRLPCDKDNLSYKTLQKGLGLYSLCEKCNNDTGSYYGPEYVGFANETIRFFIDNKEELLNSNVINIKIKIHPLQFIKQVLSMFCSTTQGLITKYPELTNLLKIKETKLKSPNFKVSMFFLKNETYSYYGPICMGDIHKGTVRTASCLDLYPFGFVFDYDKNYIDERLLDITDFLTYDYGDEAIICISAPIYERNMPFPLDFRTKEEFLEGTDLE